MIYILSVNHTLEGWIEYLDTFSDLEKAKYYAKLWDLAGYRVCIRTEIKNEEEDGQEKEDPAN